jgi:transcription elongation factor Elf1
VCLINQPCPARIVRHASERVVEVRQVGYKLMMNSQCAGLTTRFAIAKIFPDADIYSSWDSTYFRTDSEERQSELRRKDSIASQRFWKE